MFTKFQHGYATTLHRSQGRTFDRSYLLYSKHWRAAASYVAMTRHRNALQLFVSRALARDLPTLARQMTRTDERRAASHFYPAVDMPVFDADAFAAMIAERNKTPARARSASFDPLSSPFGREPGGALAKEGPRRHAGAAAMPFEYMAPQTSAADKAPPPEAGCLAPHYVSPAAVPAREPAAAPLVTQSTAAPLAHATPRAAQSATPLKAQFRAAAKEAESPPAPESKKKTRRRSEGDCLSRSIRPRSVHPAAYAALRTSTAKARYRTINLGFESPSEQAGCFKISLSNQFGGGDFEAGLDHRFEDFSMPPQIGTNQNSPTL